MGKKITIELPEWAENRHIYIFAGMELLAVKYAFKNEIHIKEEVCNYCGACCRDLRPGGNPDLPIIEGVCGYLEKGGHVEKDDDRREMYRCSLADGRPFACSHFDPHLAKWEDAEEVCSIRYRIEKLED